MQKDVKKSFCGKKCLCKVSSMAVKLLADILITNYNTLHTIVYQHVQMGAMKVYNVSSPSGLRLVILLPRKIDFLS